MEKKDVKPSLIKWVLLLQQFDFEVKDRKGIENQVADNFSRLEYETIRKLGENDGFDDVFPYEHALAISLDLIQWFINSTNYLACDLAPSDLTSHQRKS